jgi:hypothetical protein
MEGGISPPSAAPDGLSSLRRQEDVSTDSHIPEPLGAQTTPPATSSPPVRRKPLPENASPVVFQGPTDPKPASPYTDRRSREQVAPNRAVPPALDDLGILLDDSVPYLPRDLDRYATRQFLWIIGEDQAFVLGLKTNTSAIYFTGFLVATRHDTSPIP